MRLVIVGYGYSSRAIHAAVQGETETVTVTTTKADKADALQAEGLRAAVFDGTEPSTALAEALGTATHLLMSAAPDAEGDPLLHHHALADAPNLQWAGYLSTVGVYGDAQGGWVDEASPAAPRSARSKARLVAEQAWRTQAERCGVALTILRLAGIYGPGRSPLDRIRAGTSRRIIKAGQVFNRIHVDDIARLGAGAMRAQTDGVLNGADDEPAPPQTVIEHAASLLGVEPPPALDFETADLTPMARSFYGENKRVSNARAKELFGPFTHPTYREGLAALMSAPSA
ncbi:MAG: NAD-dependent epimerase/dehydratase family protein [Devosiaceae bacterium]|nr:NAD-dependent epimerase/dehydratase family protein [Devosiaceae bacterium MH13]